MKKLILLFLLVPLISCSDHQTNNSWGSYATNKETQKQEFWFTSYKTREECIVDMSWQLEGKDDPTSNPNVRIKYSVTLKTFVNAPEQGRCILGD